MKRTAEGSCRAAAGEAPGKTDGAMQPDELPEAALSTAAPDEEPKGLAAGALLVAKHEAQGVRKFLHELRWLKKGKNVTEPTPAQLRAAGLLPPDQDEGASQQLLEWAAAGRLLALHLNHAGASLMPELETVEGEDAKGLRELEVQGRLRFAPGLRVGMARNPRLEPWADNKEPGGADKPRFTLIELFAGIGGFRIGLGAVGGRSVFASEIDREAQDIYCRNFKSGLLAGDITDVDLDDIPPHDMLTGGFCCQPFSKAGKQEGFDDARGQLFYEIIRVLRHRRPATFLLENVANLLLHDNGGTLKEIVSELEDAGYLVTYRVINSSTLLPQHRQRVYFAGFRNDLVAEFESFRWPEMPLLGRTTGEILEPDGPGLETHRLSERQWEKICSNPDFREDPGRRAVMRHGPSRTLMASYKASFYMHSEFVFPANEPFTDVPAEAPRFYTPRECARLQGFPEDFVLEGSNLNRIYHSLGNAISPPVVAAIGGCILRALELGKQGTASSGDDARLSDRGALEPALRLVEAACPAPEPTDTTDGRQEARGALSQQIRAFLEQGPPRSLTAAAGEAGERAVPVHVGYTEDIHRCGGPGPLAALLGSLELRPQMVALRDVAYMAHSPPVPEDVARSNRAAMAGHLGFLDRIVGIAASSVEETGGGQEGMGDGCSRDGAAEGSSEGVKGLAGGSHRDRGVAAEVQRLAVMSLAHFGAYPDSAQLLPPEASEVLRRTADNNSNSAKLRKDAASALAAIRENSGPLGAVPTW